MTNREIIKNILIKEFDKINNVNYHIRLSSSLFIKVNTKKINQNLIDICNHFEAGVGKEYRFDSNKSSYFWLSYSKIWSKFIKETGLNYTEIQSLVKDVIEGGFKLKGITPLTLNGLRIIGIEEGFKLKGITPTGNSSPTSSVIEEGFKLKGITPRAAVSYHKYMIEEKGTPPSNKNLHKSTK